MHLTFAPLYLLVLRVQALDADFEARESCRSGRRMHAERDWLSPLDAAMNCANEARRPTVYPGAQCPSRRRSPAQLA